MIRSTRGPISTLIPKLRGKTTLLAAVAVILLAASSPILAQTNPPLVDRAIPPAREGNIYDHKDHQPTEAEVSRTGRPQSVNAAPVEKGVEEFLKQMDKLDKQSEEQLELH